MADRNWEYLLKLLPEDWKELATRTKAVTRLRGFGTVDHLLRTLLLHVGLGCSLRETVVVAKASGWAEISDVALLKKLRQSEGWLRELCGSLLREAQLEVPGSHGLRIRLVDGTQVKETGPTGSLWRVHYSLRVPEWTCDQFKLTGTEGEGSGESLRQFTIKPGDCLIADRGYAHAAGLAHVCQQGGHVLVRHHAQILPVQDRKEQPIDVLEWLKQFDQPGQTGEREVWLPVPAGKPLRLRLCAVRKSAEAIVASQRKLRQRARRKNQQLRPESLAYAQWIMVLTSVPAETFRTDEVFEWYRLRWQIELAFKRIKSLADFGHLPKQDPASSRAWLYGKLLVALLTEKMRRHAGALSPWGARWCEQEYPAEPLA